MAILGRRKKHRNLGPALALVAALGLCAAPEFDVARAQGKSVSEYELKAEMLYRLAQFVKWPEETSAEKNTPFCVGVLGNDPFKGEIDAAFRNKTVGGRKVTIIREDKAENLTDCDVVFISTSEQKNLDEILKTFKGKAVLTVGEMRNFAARGGAINMTLVRQKIRFVINKSAAEESNLEISAQLLRISTIVESRTDRGD